MASLLSRKVMYISYGTNTNLKLCDKLCHQVITQSNELQHKTGTFNFTEMFRKAEKKMKKILCKIKKIIRELRKAKTFSLKDKVEQLEQKLEHLKTRLQRFEKESVRKYPRNDVIVDNNTRVNSLKKQHFLGVYNMSENSHTEVYITSNSNPNQSNISDSLKQSLTNRGKNLLLLYTLCQLWQLLEQGNGKLDEMRLCKFVSGCEKNKNHTTENYAFHLKQLIALLGEYLHIQYNRVQHLRPADTSLDGHRIVSLFRKLTSAKQPPLINNTFSVSPTMLLCRGFTVQSRQDKNLKSILLSCKYFYACISKLYKHEATLVGIHSGRYDLGHCFSKDEYSSSWNFLPDYNVKADIEIKSYITSNSNPHYSIYDLLKQLFTDHDINLPNVLNALQSKEIHIETRQFEIMKAVLLLDECVNEDKLHKDRAISVATNNRLIESAKRYLPIINVVYFEYFESAMRESFRIQVELGFTSIHSVDSRIPYIVPVYIDGFIYRKDRLR